MARSLNKVIIIGNLTRDPELRYTPQGTAVCTIGVATNRQWKTDGEAKEEVEYHRLVVWDKLAEICAQFLKKGRKAYFEGRLQTRKWTTQEGTERQTTEIVVSDMIILDSARRQDEEIDVPEDLDQPSAVQEKAAKPKKSENKKQEALEQPAPDDSDIPF